MAAAAFVHHDDRTGPPRRWRGGGGGFNQQITGGCQATPLLYCPNNPVLRQQMAVFLVKTFGLQLYSN